MFQSFQSKSKPEASKPRLKALRAEMTARQLDWYLVPHSDEHQNEYLPERAERLAYLTGFTGSAGFAIIGLRKAYLFVDGRYTAQAQSQCDLALFQICDLVSSPPVEFAKSIVRKGSRIGFDPWLITIGQFAGWKKTASATASELVAEQNLVDLIWKDQPPAPSGKAWLHKLKFAGQAPKEKLANIRAQLQTDKADWLVQSDPASLAWTFNLRGEDLVHNPLALGWALIPASAKMPMIFIDSTKLSSADLKSLQKIAVIHPPAKFEEKLTILARDSRLHCDPALVASHLGEMISRNGGTLVNKRDPVVLLRAIKNATELDGARNAHVRDGVAMTRFLAWLDGQNHGTVDEIGAASKLEKFRFETAREMGSELKEISFDTISGAGANGAIVHYRVNEKTNAKLAANSIYLVDSGGQYVDGTTDITRTVAIGVPPKQAVIDNTLVLKGHISIAAARFPKGTRGVDLDVLARIALWQQGKDYAHGTGHGIGSYLNVHEGPQSISKRGMEAFEAGMIVSNEPGYYREGAYGIRIENLVVVTPEQANKVGDKPMMGFETITLCPFDLRLVDKTMLTIGEITWINNYHKRVFEILSPHLGTKDNAWLKKATRKL